METNWIPLTEYSSKYQVSISTLRRRIKTDDIRFQFADGRYLIFDEPQKHRPSPAAIISPSPENSFNLSSGPAGLELGKSYDGLDNSLRMQMNIQTTNDRKDHKDHKIEEPILAVANRLLTELKRAYSQILQEKEEQLLRLKEEQADLKTLVRVLEAENDRLSKKSSN